jgi:hypothetical protein
MTKTKDFDCVEMMHCGSLRIHEMLKGKSKEERLAYWRNRHAEAIEELRQARKTRPVSK